MNIRNHVNITLKTNFHVSDVSVEDVCHLSSIFLLRHLENVQSTLRLLYDLVNASGVQDLLSYSAYT